MSLSDFIQFSCAFDLPIENSISVTLFKKQTALSRGNLNYLGFKQLLKDMFVVSKRNAKDKFDKVEKLLERRQ